MSLTAKLKAFCLIETESSAWKLRGFALPVDTRYIAGCMHSNNIASHRSTARGRGQVRRSLQSHTFLQASKFERKANRNEVFIATQDSRRLHYHFPLFYLQAASKTQAFDAGDTLWRPSSSWVDFETRSPLLLFVANPRGLKLNYTHWHWASKSILGWLHLFSQTARLVSHPSKPRAVVVRGSSSDRDRRHGNWSSSCLEVPTPMSRSIWPFRAMETVSQNERRRADLQKGTSHF